MRVFDDVRTLADAIGLRLPPELTDFEIGIVVRTAAIHLIAARRVMEWVPVTSGNLPDCNESVIVTDGDTVGEGGLAAGGDSWYWASDDGEHGDQSFQATHWMPMPGLP